MTKSEIITFARTKVGEDNSDSDLSDIHLGTLLNGRYQDVCNFIVGVNEGFFAKLDTTIDLVNGTDLYDLPDVDSNSRTRIIRILRIEIAYDGTNYYHARPIQVQDLPPTNFIDTQYSTLSPVYYLLDNKIYFLPTPTENKTNAVKIWYIQRQLDLSADSDIPQFPEQYHHILGWGLAADIMQRTGARVLDLDDASYADRFEGKYQEGLEKLLETIKPRDISSPKYVVDEDFSVLNGIDYIRPGSVT